MRWVQWVASRTTRPCTRAAKLSEIRRRMAWPEVMIAGTSTGNVVRASMPAGVDAAWNPYVAHEADGVKEGREEDQVVRGAVTNCEKALPASTPLTVSVGCGLA